MEWITENWLWILLFVLFIGMHRFGHSHGSHWGRGGHGGGHTHGDHASNEEQRETQEESSVKYHTHHH